MFRVRWEEIARQDVRDILDATSDLLGVTRAAVAAEDRLADDPSAGRHQSEGLWQLTVHPLLVSYEVDRAAGVVTISGVGLVS